jgi:flagellin-like hook-associated protein FlgL
MSGLANIVGEQTYVLGALFGAGAFDSESQSRQSWADSAGGNPAAVAIIDEPLRGRIAEPQQTIRQTAKVISLTQTLEEALAAIGLRLNKMRELAGQPGDRVSQIRQQLEALASEINDITDITQFNGNKLFGSQGHSIVMGMGNGMIVNIGAKDFSFEIENDSLFEDFKNLFEKIRDEIEAVREYDDSLVSVRNQVQNISAKMQSELEDALNVAAHINEQHASLEVNAYTVSRVLQEGAKALRGQANVDTSRAFKLLKGDPTSEMLGQG